MYIHQPTKETPSFDELYLANFERLCKYAVSILGDMDTAKDIVNDVFMRVWRGWDDIDFSRVDHYLYQSVHNRSLDYLRKLSRQSDYAEEVLKITDEFYQDESEARERDLLVSQMMEQLPEKSRNVLTEYYLEQRKQTEIAQDLGVSPDAIKKQVAKALKLLRELCSQHYK